jgi:hypothetical protein
MVDNASPEVIVQSQTACYDFVRLYFRPLTPTQFDNEGIRAPKDIKLNAHCPVPVFFCFDSLDILSGDSTQFSNGNMAANGVEFNDSCDFFNRIPFQYVYHNRAIWSDEPKSEIVFHRNAEVLIPNELPLDNNLKFIACRSEPERQTLLKLLSQSERSRWAPKIRLSVDGIFERKWTYIEAINANDDLIIIKFNPNTKSPGPFQLSFKYEESPHKDINWVDDNFNLINYENELRLKITSFKPSFGTVTISMDKALAYQGTQYFEIPF